MKAAILSQVAICASSQQQPRLMIETGAEPDTLVVTFNSGRAPAVTALQWEISIPQALSVNLADIAVGAAAQKSGKSLTCGPKKAAAREVRYACIVAGGQDGLEEGALAVVRYRRNGDVHGAPIRVVVENVTGATADVKRVAIPGAQAIIRAQ